MSIAVVLTVDYPIENIANFARLRIHKDLVRVLAKTYVVRKVPKPLSRILVGLETRSARKRNEHLEKGAAVFSLKRAVTILIAKLETVLNSIVIVGDEPGEPLGMHHLQKLKI